MRCPLESSAQKSGTYNRPSCPACGRHRQRCRKLAQGGGAHTSSNRPGRAKCCWHRGTHSVPSIEVVAPLYPCRCQASICGVVPPVANANSRTGSERRGRERGYSTCGRIRGEERLACTRRQTADACRGILTVRGYRGGGDVTSASATCLPRRILTVKGLLRNTKRLTRSKGYSWVRRDPSIL